MDERARLQQGLCALGLAPTEQQLDRLLAFAALLYEKNRVMNLTAVDELSAVIDRHFLDSAVLCRFVSPKTQVIDVGSGAGFPGLPLAILTEGEFTLLDAQRKRVDFLGEVISALGLTNCTAIHGRAEDFAAQNRECFSLSVSRAVADLRMLAELCLPLTAVGGTMLSLKAADCEAEVQQAQNALQMLGAGKITTQKVTLPDGISRAVLQVEKAQPTPPAYPRRFAKIKARPL